MIRSLKKVLLMIGGLILCFHTLKSQQLPAGPQVLTFFSQADDTEQPYGLYLPKNYDPAKKYPFVMMLHGAGSNHRLALRRVFGKSNAPGETDVEATQYFPEWRDIDFIVASPFARGTMGYQGIAEKDVWDVLADVKKRFNIDEDRTYLTGLSMGGGGTLWIGLTRPDVWAAMAPVCPAPPSGAIDLIPNALNVPMHFFHGDADQAVPVSVSREWTQKLKAAGAQVEYKEYPGVQHNSWENAYADEAVFEWFSRFRRNAYPDRITFNSRNFKYNKAYWVRFDDLTPGTLASIDAKFTGTNQLQVKTSGLHAFTLFLAKHPKYKEGQTLQLVINGAKLKVQAVDSLSLTQREGKWSIGKFVAPPLFKKKHVEGPISAAFSERHLYVYGTADNPTEEELKKRMEIATQAANWSAYRNAFLGRIMFFPRIIADKEIRPSDLRSSNLILFGTRETNSVIQKYANQLPFHLTGSPEENGLIYIYPIEGHYAVISSGLPWWSGLSPQHYRFVPPALMGLNDLKDYVLFKGSVSNPISEGYFDKNWRPDKTSGELLQKSGAVAISN